MNILITGGAGFIGSVLTKYVLNDIGANVLVYDKLTYAGNILSLNDVQNKKNFEFVKGDICDKHKLKKVFIKFKPNLVINLAAESHVDRSIDSPADFIQTNILGTFVVLEVARDFWSKKADDFNFRFHHVSTDEVFGDLDDENCFFNELTSYNPSSPYSASKASSDHLVRSWYRTYGLPIVITNCSNNYGPYQFPEKLIPHMILSAISGKALPVYGDGLQSRDWLHVEDHARAIVKVAFEAKDGETYNIGGNNEVKNIDVIKALCDLLEELVPNKPEGVDLYENLITFVKDRPGHDKRYAIDASKIQKDLGWYPEETFETGLRKTVEWYLSNQTWWKSVLDGNYRLDRIGKGI